MSKIKSFLRLIKRVLDKTLGTKTDEIYWRFRHFFDKSWAENYIIENADHPSKQLLIEIITKYTPLKSVLEVGCASGPNLYALSKKFPDARFFGIDISKKAIRVGTAWISDKKIKNIELFEGKADELGRFPDKSVDIILSVAMLIYVGPDKIDRVIEEMIRVTRKAVILIEWNSEKEYSYEFDHWAYNWKALFEKQGETNISLTKLKSEDSAGGWKELGHLVEVLKNSN